MSVEEIKKNLNSDKMIIGKRVVLKRLREGKIVKVFLASNAEDSLRDDIEHYKSIVGYETEVLTISNDELGTICKKPFAVSVIGVMK